MTPRFKIDLNNTRSADYHMAVYILRDGWFQDWWERLEVFENIDDARKFIKKLKDLPEFHL